MEAAPTPGGARRSAALTSPGFVHAVCSTVHPLGVGLTGPLGDHALPIPERRT